MNGYDVMLSTVINAGNALVAQVYSFAGDINGLAVSLETYLYNREHCYFTDDGEMAAYDDAADKATTYLAQALIA